MDVSRETRARSIKAPEAMIFARGLSKDFKKVKAVENLDLDIAAGEVFGLLGPNGAGKTTTIRMLSALIAPTSGEAWVAKYRVGQENDEIRKRVGILTETPGLYEQLSAERNLAFFAQLYDVQEVGKQVERYLRMLGLWGRREEAVGTFSKGMRQKLAIARALLHEPEVLFLDEPTSGLDPEAAHLVREFISELGEEGRTIILCTHNLDEADRLCDRVAVFKTRLLAIDTPTNLRHKLFGRAVVFHLAEVKTQFIEAVRQKTFVHHVETLDNKLIVKIDDPETHNPELVQDLVRLGGQIQFVGEIRQSLEDVYLQLLGNDGKEYKTEVQQ
jgi:ABC-2 type transport system ATP-binding protein